MRIYALGLVGVWTIFGALYACSGSDETTTGGSSGGDGNNGGSTSTSSGSGGEGGLIIENPDSGTDATQDACAATSAQATIVERPVDIIFVIDNSGSMSGEIAGVEDNINSNFASIIESSGVDYRVIMLTDHGSGSLELCVQPPLSSTTSCSGAPGNSSRFFHYSNNIQSTDALCKLIDLFNATENPNTWSDSADEFGQAPDGYQQWLREDAFKIIVAVTDDAIYCEVSPDQPNPSVAGSFFSNYGDDVDSGYLVADSFDNTLMMFSPSQFGTPAKRDYKFYSIIGIAPKADPTEPYYPSDPVVTTLCSGGVNSAPAYQWLSIGTGALRFPVCNGSNFSVVFNEIAQGVIEGASAPCEFAMPEPPPGETLDPNTLEVIYTPGGDGTPVKFTQVLSLSSCLDSTDNFYIEDDTIKLCPGACDLVTVDENAAVEILMGCGSPPPA